MQPTPAWDKLSFLGQARDSGNQAATRASGALSRCPAVPRPPRFWDRAVCMSAVRDGTRDGGLRTRVPAEGAPHLGGASEEPGPICGRPPTCKSEAACGSDRLRSYVRSVDGGAHDRLPRWVPRREFQTELRCQAPLGPTECLASGIDRSHHLLCLLASSGLSARRRLPSRRTRYALVIITASGSRGVVHDRSEGRGAEPPRSAAPRPSRATADVVATWRAGS